MVVLPLFTFFCLVSTQLSPIHKKGYCVMREQCGYDEADLLSRELNCLYNEKAPRPNDTLVEFYQDVCAALPMTDINEGLCCSIEQLVTLKQNLKRLEPIVGQCPACKNNLAKLFCSLTCSNYQSMYMNVTKTTKSSSDKTVVTEMDFYVSEEFGSSVYDSCKDVKLSASNSFALDFIAPGATDYRDLLKSIGRKSAIGSPFQINFPVEEHLEKLKIDTNLCHSRELDSRCSCTDCEKSCPKLRPLKKEQRFWNLSCGLIKCYTLGLSLLYPLVILIGISTLRSRIKARIWLFLKSCVPYLNRFHTQKLAIYPESFGLENSFKHIAEACCNNKRISILCFMAFLLLGISGLLHIEYETDPTKLWAEKESPVYKQKEIFDSRFGPFYRTQQIILSSHEPIIKRETITEIFDIIDDIKKIRANGTKIEDFCFKPLDESCLIQSITNYWDDNKENFVENDEDALNEKLDDCINDPSYCMPSSGVPTKPEFILGGELIDNKNYTQVLHTSKAFVITVILLNSQEESYLERVISWERHLVDYLQEKRKKLESKEIYLDFSSESSLEYELNKSTNTDIKIVILSYLAMFAYIVLSMTSFRYNKSAKKIYILSKFWLSFFSITLVVLSVLCSFGLCSYFGLKTTLITAEVVPFLVLAIGTDNIFLLVNEKENLKHHAHQSISSDSQEEFSDLFVETQYYQYDKSSSDAIRSLSNLGTSMLGSALCEIFTFALAYFVRMPAVSSFSVYAAVAIFINFVFQITIFVILLSEENNINPFRFHNVLSKLKICGVEFSYDENETMGKKESMFENIFDNFYVPFVFKPTVKKMGFYGLLAFFMLNLYLLPKVDLGLEQKISFPKESHLVNYFNSVEKYLRIGPPLYFVVEKNNAEQGITLRSEQQKFCSRFSSCQQFSLPNILEQERKRTHVSFIEQPSSALLDDFFNWLNPENDRCCNVNEFGDLCDPDFDTKCYTCLKENRPAWNITMEGFPENEDFIKYMNLWLKSKPNEYCPLGGKGSYTDSIVLGENDVAAFNFRTYHPPLKKQGDYINAYKQALRISQSFEKKLDTKNRYSVFPYSIFYIFFDQYTYIVGLAWKLLTLAIISIGIINYLMCKSLRIVLISMAIITMIIVDIIGVSMVFLRSIHPEEPVIMMNAISLVNLMISIGISVEFIVHTTFEFLKNDLSSEGDVDLQKHSSKHALSSRGKGVFTGIASTKFIGILVLSFTRSPIFKIYYFKMYMVMVLLCSLHGLLFLPIALDMFGSSKQENIVE